METFLYTMFILFGLRAAFNFARLGIDEYPYKDGPDTAATDVMKLIVNLFVFVWAITLL